MSLFTIRRQIFKIILILSFFIPSSVLFSQNGVVLIDSSLQRIEPELRIDTLISRGWKYSFSNIKLAQKYYKEAARLGEIIHNTHKTGNAYLNLGLSYLHIGNLDSAYIYFNKAINLAEFSSDVTILAFAYTYISEYYNVKNELFLSLFNVKKAKSIFEKHRNNYGLMLTQIQLAKIYITHEKYDDAEKILTKFDKNYAIYHRSLSFLIKRLRTIVYIRKGETKKLNELINELDKKFGKSKRDLIISYINYFKGEYNFLIKNYELSKKYFRKAIENTNSKGKFLEIFSLNGLFKDFVHQSRLDSANYYLRLSENIAKQNGYLAYYVTLLKNHINFYAKINDAHAVHYITHKVINIIDSVSAVERNIRNEEFLKLMRLNEIKTYNTKLNQDIYNQKILIKIIIIAIVFLVAFILVFIMQRQKIKQSTLYLERLNSDKNTLFSIIAHDLKNPFNSLLGFSDLLLEELKDDYSIIDVRDGIKQMRAASQNLLDMVETLLQWVQSQTGEIKFSPDYINLNEVILQVYSYFSQSAKAKGIELKLQMPGESKCYCDKEMIATIIRNLLSNSIKYCSEGDFIKISVEKVKPEGKIYLVHEDSGRGMTKEQLQNLFSSSLSTKGTKGEKGTGLGMLLIYEMVKKNNGEIYVDSKLGVGTKFTILLPMNKNNT